MGWKQKPGWQGAGSLGGCARVDGPVGKALTVAAEEFDRPEGRYKVPGDGVVHDLDAGEVEPGADDPEPLPPSHACRHRTHSPRSEGLPS